MTKGINFVTVAGLFSKAPSTHRGNLQRLVQHLPEEAGRVDDPAVHRTDKTSPIIVAKGSIRFVQIGIEYPLRVQLGNDRRIVRNVVFGNDWIVKISRRVEAFRI